MRNSRTGTATSSTEKGGASRVAFGKSAGRARLVGGAMAGALLCGCMALCACNGTASSTSSGTAAGSGATAQTSTAVAGGSNTVLSLSQDEVASLFADSSSFKGQTITLTGTVVPEPDLGDNTHAFKLIQDPTDKKNIVSVSYEPDGLTVGDGDYLTVTGVVGDPVQKVTQDGSIFEMVTLAATDVKTASYKDAMHPTLLEKDVNLSVDQDDCSITLEKVEYAADETRVYIKAENNGSRQLDIRTTEAVLTQGGQDFNQSFNDKSDYQQVSARLEPGDSTEGVLCFSNIAQEGFTLSIPGRLDGEDMAQAFEYTVE